ncbi:MAG: toprim domain-containing protein [Oscillospiraceae bacterium]
MLHLEQAVIVEGKYDKIKLSSVIDAVIITTNGFSVIKDKEKLEIIRFFAKNKGIIILTDSDSAGFKIRNFLKGAISDGKITNVYIPDIFGKEKRKNAPSKEGKLGVEGIDTKILLEAFSKAGVISAEADENKDPVTKLDLYEAGLTGGTNSAEKRSELLKYLGMPELMTTNAMLEIINTMMSRSDFFDIIGKISERQEI